MLDAYERHIQQRDAVKDTAFDVWQAANSAEFWLLLAYGNGTRDNLTDALGRLEAACAAARAKLGELE